MVHQNKLRRNNLLSYGDKIVFVDSIFVSHFNCIDYVTGVSYGDSIRANYKPIELSHEILEKCGFEYDASYHVPKVQKDNFILWDGSDGTFSANFGHMIDLSVYVRHLHQLQNLYFALTGEEITVNL